MAIGFVLVSSKPTKEHDVYGELSNIKEIIEINPLFGDYDFIAKIETGDFNQLGEIVVNRVRSIEGVQDTKTLTGLRF